MVKIIALTDYKNRFGSKHFDHPYRSGMDKDLLTTLFLNSGFEIEFTQFTELINRKDIPKNCYYLYTSSEDIHYRYKNFIEDCILFLQQSGCKVIPGYDYMRANNNKVFMELLRKSTGNRELQTIVSEVFGTYEEAMSVLLRLQFPVVIKTSEGATGRGVFKAENEREFKKKVKKVSNSFSLFYHFKEFIRVNIHKGYIRESDYRNKFIVQNMIKGLHNDWKVYFFGDKYYIFYRPVFKHRGFRASGGGYDNYFYGEEAKAEPGLLSFAEDVVRCFKVPNASIDIAWDGTRFHLIEIQFLYFGTAGIPYSGGYFTKDNSDWKFVENKLSIEEVYARSIELFINNNS